MTSLATILAIETATSNCSVALQFNGNVISRSQDGNNVHSQVLLDMVSEVLAQAELTRSDIQAVAVGQGPGSFTGLRIGVGVAQGLAYGIACPMIGISSLDALANLAPEFGQSSTVLAGIDARMGEIYWCEYVRQGVTLKRCSELMVSQPQDIVLEQNKPLVLVGNAWSEYADGLSDSIRQAEEVASERRYPTAESILSLAQHAFAAGEVISPIDFAPEYVRNNVAKKSTKVFGKRRK